MVGAMKNHKAQFAIIFCDLNAKVRTQKDGETVIAHFEIGTRSRRDQLVKFAERNIELEFQKTANKKTGLEKPYWRDEK